MVDTPDTSSSDDQPSVRRLFLIRLIFLSLGIWSVCTLVCGVILSVICIQRGQPNYTVLAIVLTSLGMTGVITSLPCCLYFCLTPSRHNDAYRESTPGPETPSVVSDIFIHFSHRVNQSDRGWENTSPVLFGVFGSRSPRGTLACQAPPPYDPPPCYEDAALAARRALAQPVVTRQ